MIYNKLGRTGLDCSKLGFGTWQIGGGRWKGMSDDESIALLRKAKEVGINIFDAAVVYGQYNGKFNEKRSHSLELLGKAFPNEKRNEVIICLKIGQIDEYSHRAFYKPDRLVKQIKQALLQLNTDYIDICLIHAPTISEVKSQQALRVIQTLRALGIVKFIGYSFEDEPEHAKIAIDQDIDVLMLQYNLIDISCAEIFDIADSKGVGVLVGGPLKRGYLSGEFEKISDLPTEDDYWNWNLRYSRKKVEQTLQKVNDLKIKYGNAKTLRESAFEFINSNYGVSSIIVGHRKELEVEENLNAFLKINQCQ
jgi:aryl-alcohol dehydrogenase-like predicted oxidoreductase